MHGTMNVKKKNPQQIGVVNQTEECLQVATTLVHSFIHSAVL